MGTLLLTSLSSESSFYYKFVPSCLLCFQSKAKRCPLGLGNLLSPHYLKMSNFSNMAVCFATE